MSPLDIVPWESMGRYGMGYPTKYTTPFRAVISRYYNVIKDINIDIAITNTNKFKERETYFKRELVYNNNL